MAAESLHIQNGIIIPGHELEIQASLSGGPGGQHVNKTHSRITLRWYLESSESLSDSQRAYSTTICSDPRNDGQPDQPEPLSANASITRRADIVQRRRTLSDCLGISQLPKWVDHLVKENLQLDYSL